MIVEDIICDCCGKSCKVQEFDIDNELNKCFGEKARSFEYMKMEAAWGYDSKKDMEKWTAYICETCVDEKFKDIKFEKTQLRFNGTNIE